MIPLIGIGVAIVALDISALLITRRRRRTPPELRGDWWPRFEDEFAPYMERASEEGAYDRS
jgi:hypothetical protein